MTETTKEIKVKKVKPEAKVQTLVKAEARTIRIAPRKVDRVVKLIRGKGASEALVILKFQPHFGARHVEKVLKSAMANAQNNNKWDLANLVVAKAVVNYGTLLKRFRAGGKGSAKRIKKYTSHILIELKDKSMKGDTK